MAKCLITKLNTIIQNDKLDVFGQLKISFACSATTPTNVFRQGGIYGENMSIIVTNGYICDIDGNMIGDGHHFNFINPEYRIKSDSGYVNLIINNSYNMSIFSVDMYGEKIEGITMKDFSIRSNIALKELVLYLTNVDGSEDECVDTLRNLKKSSNINVTPPKNIKINLSNINFVWNYRLWGSNYNFIGTIEDYFESLSKTNIENGDYEIIAIMITNTLNGKPLNNSTSFKSTHFTVTDMNIIVIHPFEGDVCTYDRNLNTWIYSV